MIAKARTQRWSIACLIAMLGVQPAARAETYAFLVGVSNYESKTELKPLKFACEDIISFAGALRNSGVPLKNIVMLHDSQTNPRFKPSGKKILKEFHLLLATLEPEDSLIVALAGHGVELGASGENYFLPSDAELKDPATLINVKTIFDEMERSQAGRKLLLVDACRNDPEADNARSAGIALLPPKRMVAGPMPAGIAALFSCNSEQRSYEDPVLRHGIFFYQVIKAWEGEADVDRDGQVTLEELESFVRRQTKNHARDALSAIQKPVFRVDRQTANGWVVAARRAEPPRPEIGGLLDRGDALRRLGNHDEAEREYARALQADPDSSKAHLAMAKLQHARGQFAAALREYSEAIRIDPNDASAFVGRAIASGDSGNLTSALDDFDQAIRIAPGLALAYVGKGAILARLNRPDEAIAACSRAIALDGKNARAYFNRGVARELKKDATGAAQDFQKAAQLDPRLKAR
jgi:tetratricopeptide (TPR) repeat protein